MPRLVGMGMGKPGHLLLQRAQFQYLKIGSDPQAVEITCIVGQVEFIGSAKDPEFLRLAQVFGPLGRFGAAASVVLVIEEVWIVVRSGPLRVQVPWLPAR